MYYQNLYTLTVALIAISELHLEVCVCVAVASIAQYLHFTQFALFLHIFPYSVIISRPNFPKTRSHSCAKNRLIQECTIIHKIIFAQTKYFHFWLISRGYYFPNYFPRLLFSAVIISRPISRGYYYPT